MSTARVSLARSSLLGGIQFNQIGSQNYLSLGTMGNFGSNLGNGFYCQFQVKITATSSSYIIGTNNVGNNSAALIGVNQGRGAAGKTNGIRLYIHDNNGHSIDSDIANTPPTITDGYLHTITVQWDGGSATTVSISVDGVSQPIEYNIQQTLSGFSNWSFPMTLGARNNGGTVSSFTSCILSSVQLGNSPSNLYGKYAMSETSGTTISDSSGKGNNGTLMTSSGSLPLFLNYSRATAGARSTASGRTLVS